MPALEFEPEKPAAGAAVLYVHGGKATDAGPGGAIEKLVRQGRRVLAVDLRGTGQTKSAAAANDVGVAYLLGRAYVACGPRTCWSGPLPRGAIACLPGGGAASRCPAGGALVAVGRWASLPCTPPAGTRDVRNRQTRADTPLLVGGGADPGRGSGWTRSYTARWKRYDLPDLAGLLGDKLTVAEPSDGGR